MKKPKSSPKTSSVQLSSVASSASPEEVRISLRFRRPSPRLLLVLLVLLISIIGIAAIPSTRYAVMGLVDHRSVTIMVVDKSSAAPISNVAVAFDGKTGETDRTGMVHLKKIAVGRHTLSLKKAYYAATDVQQTVSITASKVAFTLPLAATGRVVDISVHNKLSGKPVSGVVLAIAGTKATTNTQGAAQVVLPLGKAIQSGSLALSGYNTAVAGIHLDGTNDSFQIVPTGKLYYLDKRTGVINVMKSDLDGTNPQVVLAGTGSEDDRGTVLLASRDWKYLALLAQRDGDKPKLYLITTATDKLDTIDEGDITFSLVGWSGSTFVYTVDREKAINGQYPQTALKVYNASSDHLSVIDQTDAEQDADTYSGYIRNSFSTPYLVDDTIIYTKFWDYFQPTMKATLYGRTQYVYAASIDSGVKKTLATFDGARYQTVQARAYAPDEIYYALYGGAPGGALKYEYYEYEDGKFQTTDETSDSTFFSAPYPTYLLSPSGKSTLWYESRDGKNTLFTGDANGKSAKQIASLTDYIPYGWYSDNYILLSKGGSELYIAPSDYSKAPIKVTDYHKPGISYPGYGGGYGGN